MHWYDWMLLASWKQKWHTQIHQFVHPCINTTNVEWIVLNNIGLWSFNFSHWDCPLKQPWVALLCKFIYQKHLAGQIPLLLRQLRLLIKEKKKCKRSFGDRFSNIWLFFPVCKFVKTEKPKENPGSVRWARFYARWPNQRSSHDKIVHIVSTCQHIRE